MSTPPILRIVSYGVPEPVSYGCMSGLRDSSDRFALSRRTGTGREATGALPNSRRWRFSKGTLAVRSSYDYYIFPLVL